MFPLFGFPCGATTAAGGEINTSNWFVKIGSNLLTAALEDV
jgi:hypothetical protein